MTTTFETAITATDPDRLATFYAAVLGLTEKWRTTLTDSSFDREGLGTPCTVICLESGTGQRLKVLGPAHTTREEAEHVVSRAGTPLITVAVDDMAPVLERFAQHGGGFRGKGEPIDFKPGILIAFLTDPEGNAVEVIERRP